MAYELKQNWCPEWLYPLKSTYPMTPQGIVVHNTAGTASAASEIASMIGNTSSATSFHVAIDEAQAVEAFPFSRCCWHAGDGGQGYANRNLIGIEICRSFDWSSDKYDKAEANAVLYVAEVCVQYGWTSDQLHQHNWYAGTSCPHRLKDHWESFKQAVDKRIAEIQSGVPESKPAPGEAAAAKDTMRVALHGYPRDIRGENKDGTVYVALRDLLEQMGYAVGWQDGVVTVEYKK